MPTLKWSFLAREAAGEAFHVVITDLGMPYVDGRQVATAVKSTRPDTPVLMLTGWGRQWR
ncbi:MAG: response regulator [Gammaproteobacteria bacterium]|nr:MAG: response regulator [Gammaproteobacteria bacterium]